MKWPSIRDFLNVPSHLTGSNVAIAVVDGYFPPHPDITTNDKRHVFLVKTSEADPKPHLFHKSADPWRNSHGLSTAAAAAGSGSLAKGYYSGSAPEAELYLIETGAFQTVEETEKKFVLALNWLLKNFRQYSIRAIVLTLAYTRDTGLLPWQADPIRVCCEQLVAEGLLVIVASGNTKELTCSGPASSPSVLSVGGVIVPQDQEAVMEYHGCRGMTFEGKQIPEILAPAENVVLPYPFLTREEYEDHYTAPYDNLPEGYARTEGTSYAAPIILGCAACIWQANPQWTANQMESAMRMTAAYKEGWYSGVAGLVQVKEAAAYPPEPISKEYNRDHHDADVVAKVHAATRSPFKPSSEITYDLIEVMLTDSNRYVKMAALFVLQNRENIRLKFLNQVMNLLNDPDINIQYCAIKLASAIEDPCFIKPLISGLLDDALQQRVSTFGARCEGLQLIAGIEYEPEPKFRDGQCFYSELSTESRISVALQWQQYVSSY